MEANRLWARVISVDVRRLSSSVNGHDYGNPIRWAAIPIARARGTEILAGWFALRNIAPDVTADVFGNLVPVKPEGALTTEHEGSRTVLKAGEPNVILLTY